MWTLELYPVKELEMDYEENEISAETKVDLGRQRWKRRLFQEDVSVKVG